MTKTNEGARRRKYEAHAWTSLPAALAAAIAAAGVAPAHAQANDRWTAHESEASATLPEPKANALVSGGVLSCAAQKWTLALTPAANAMPEGGQATMTIGGDSFDLTLEAKDGTLSGRVAGEAIEPLKDGVRLEIVLPAAADAPAGPVAFPLRGSRVAITAAAERCTLRDMSGYTPVTFTPFSSYLGLARELRADDMEAFRVSTASDAKLDAAMLEFGPGKRLLLSRLCGSSWYYGSSGCNINGHAPDGEGWRLVYDSENVHLYTDPKSASDGWPDLATLPVGTQSMARLWRWNGNVYAFEGELPDED